MATNTPNYGLIKPGGSDAPDIPGLNPNWDKIDTELKKNETNIGLLPIASYEVVALTDKPVTYTLANNAFYRLIVQAVNFLGLSEFSISTSGNDTYLCPIVTTPSVTVTRTGLTLNITPTAYWRIMLIRFKTS